MTGYSIGRRGEVSNSLLYKRASAGPWLLASAELCAKGYVQAQETGCKEVAGSKGLVKDVCTTHDPVQWPTLQSTAEDAEMNG